MKTAAAAIATEQSTGTWTNVSHPGREDTSRPTAARSSTSKGTGAPSPSRWRTSPWTSAACRRSCQRHRRQPVRTGCAAGRASGGLRLPQEHDQGVQGPEVRHRRACARPLKRPEKPLVGTIVKPKIGLPPQGYHDYIYEAGMGGLTNGKDDETLSNQKFCPLEDRVVAIAEAIDGVKQETGHRMMHAINVTTRGRQDPGGGGEGAGAGRHRADGGRAHRRLRGRPGAGRGPVHQSCRSTFTGPCTPRSPATRTMGSRGASSPS